MTRRTPTVLVVDDEPGLVDLYAAWLAPDYDVVTARDGAEGLAELDDDTDVVVLDREMPRVSGDEFLERCRAAGWDCRVLMVTGTEPDYDALSLGFDAYLMKPVDRATVRDYVAMLSRRQAYSDEVKELFAVVAKLALIDEDMRTNGFHEAYERLANRRDELRGRIDGRLDAFDRQDFEAEFRRLSMLELEE